MDVHVVAGVRGKGGKENWHRRAVAAHRSGNGGRDGRRCSTACAAMRRGWWGQIDRRSECLCAGGDFAVRPIDYTAGHGIDGTCMLLCARCGVWVAIHLPHVAPSHTSVSLQGDGAGGGRSNSTVAAPVRFSPLTGSWCTCSREQMHDVCHCVCCIEHHSHRCSRTSFLCVHVHSTHDCFYTLLELLLSKAVHDRMKNT